MPIELGPTSDLTLDEMRSVIATVFKLPAEEIEDFLIVIKRPCRNCQREYCGDGPIGTVSSRAGTNDQGKRFHQPEFELHIAGRLIDALAEQWADERNRP